MSAPFRILTAAEQLSEHLRAEILRGTWTGTMPGEDRLLASLGVGRATIKAALKKLEEEGLLQNRGSGIPREIVPQPGIRKSKALRVRILLYESADRGANHTVEILARLQGSGHAVSLANKTLVDMDFDVERVARFVEEQPADAWIVCGGSCAILEWFAAQPFAAFAVFGRFAGINIAAAGPRKIGAMLDALKILTSYGHKRIVMLTNIERRKPCPGLFEQSFLEGLQAFGLPTGAYNLPDWDEGPDGFLACLDKLYAHTPPTALLICDTSTMLMPVTQYLARRRLRVPEDVSILTDDFLQPSAWCNPAYSHIRWNQRLVVARVIEWVDNIAHGRDDRAQKVCDATLFEGGTIQPVRKD
jgi:DNA-binding LacI/PurR family transcriptional regulator